MSIKKSLAVLAVLGVMSVGAIADAASVGLVNINTLVNAYPGYGALQMQVQKVQNNYNPRIQKEMEAISKMDKSQQQSAYDQRVVPIAKQAQGEVDKIMNPMLQNIQQKIDQVRQQKNLDLVVDAPSAIISAKQDTTVTDITADVQTLLK